jgi:hypothetical protein
MNFSILAAALGTTVWTLPPAHIETALPELARQVFGQRDDPGGLLFVRTPQLLTRAAVDGPDMLSRRLDQVMPRLVPGGVLAVETHDVRNGGVVQPLGLEVSRALRQRHGLQLKEIIAVLPAEETPRRCIRRPQSAWRSRTGICWSRPVTAAPQRRSVVLCSVPIATPARCARPGCRGGRKSSGSRIVLADKRQVRRIIGLDDLDARQAAGFHDVRRLPDWAI